MKKIIIILFLTAINLVISQAFAQADTLDSPNNVKNLQQWTARGNIAIHTYKKGWNASFFWKQATPNYQIALFGPLGANRIQINGWPNTVVLQTGNRQMNAATPDELVRRATGWNLPMGYLKYWLKGVPVPNVPYKLRYDANLKAYRLSQQGWNINYLYYSTVDGYDLPGRLVIYNRYMNVKININQWTV